MEKSKQIVPINRSASPAWRALALLLLLFPAAGCSRDPPEERLRDTLVRMQQALEERAPARFMEYVAADFVGNDGVDRDALQQAVRAQVLANQRIGLVLGPAEVEMRQGSATVRFSALATGSGGRWLPERGGSWDVTTGWREEGGDWRLHYARWERR
ncbi:nuclear transport factor 2 family protein [Pseudoxanthomonas sp. SGT-18]|uniref:nuclear transport factor 2 family protein n=1 Tax=Pseudoxanthomonas sp. SGT-18 TaxID=2493087 RepID=UPI001F0C9978|nr:nuclear transport factor 2 family protein [Pseudoxanthomonas sp. SGT-18]